MEKSLTKLASATSPVNATQESRDLIKEFNSSINEKTEREINEGLSDGIRGAIQDLIGKKDDVLKLCESNTDCHNYISSIYQLLESSKPRAGVHDS